MHAVIMCRFAHYCRVQMKQITHQLEESLGSGTKDLALRVGLHSGPTTAGVLRGEKARFQLFGDTGKNVDSSHLVSFCSSLHKLTTMKYFISLLSIK